MFSKVTFFIFIFSYLLTINFVPAWARVHKNSIIKPLQLSFIENSGQLPPHYLFYKKIDHFTIFLSNEAKILFYSDNDHKIITQEFLNSKSPSILPQNLQNYTVTYIKDENIINAKCYNTIELKNIYNKIDLYLLNNNNNVEQVIYLNPGSNVEDIKIKISGITGYNLSKSGDLILNINNNKINLSKPKAFQVQGNNKRNIRISYRIIKHDDKNLIYGFKIAKYDKNKPLIIDPIIQTTYLGGSNLDYINSIVLDSTRNVLYVTGTTSSHDFPGITGAQQLSNDNKDAFIAMLTSDLSNLIQVTLIGGSKKDIATTLTFNPNSGDVYLAGYTESSDFPKIRGGGDQIHQGTTEGFIVRLPQDLKTIYQATFIGGSNNDQINSIEIDPSTGDVIVAGFTSSNDLPNTKTGAQNQSLGGKEGFLSRFDRTLTKIYVSTYFGGMNDDEITSIKLNPLINTLFIAGITKSNYLPALNNGADTSLGGNEDGFIASLDKDLTQIYQSTYIGGTNDDSVTSLAINYNSKEIVVAGHTKSTDLPAVKGHFDDKLESIDGFVTKLDFNLKSIKSSTFIGGKENDFIYSLLVNDITNEIIISGETHSNDFPKTLSGFDMTFSGHSEGFIGRLSSDLKNLIQATFFGGSGTDSITSMTIHPTNGFIYFAGFTTSQDLIMTSGGADTTISGDHEEGFISVTSSDLMLVAPVYTLTITKEQKGTGTGDVIATGCTLIWNQNTGTCTGNPAKLITITGIPKNESQWLGWSKGTGAAASCRGTNSCSFTLQTNSSIVATFDSPLPDYSLKVIKSGTGDGDVYASGCALIWNNREGICRIKAGTKVSLQAIPDLNSTFTGWKNGTGSAKTCSGTSSCVFETSTNSTITAEFSSTLKPKNKLSILKVGDGDGIIVVDGCSLIWKENTGECLATEGTEIKLSAIPDTFSIFKGWQDQKGNTTNCKDDKPCNFKLDTNSTISAYFQRRTDCAYMVIPNKLNISSEKGFFTLQIKTNINHCSWKVSTNEPWIKIISPNSGVGDGTITIEIEENTNTTFRIGLVLIDNSPIQIIQEGKKRERAQIATCDLNSDKIDDIVILYPDGTIKYTFYAIRLIDIPGNLAGGLNCVDLNNDGKADIIGLDGYGNATFTLNLGQSWYNLQAPATFTQLHIAELNGDGIPDIIGLDDKQNIYFTLDRDSWQKIDGKLSKLVFGNFNPHRHGLELAGINNAGELFVSKDLKNLELIPGKFKLVGADDLNNDGICDLIGINFFDEIEYSTNFQSWKKLNGRFKYLVTGDFNGDGNKDILGIDENNNILYTLNFNDWNLIGNNVFNLTRARLNMDQKDDIVGVDSSNRININLNLANWIILY